MSSRRRSGIGTGMPDYPVIWQTPGERPVAGRLQLGPTGVTLEGGERGCLRRVDLAYSEIVGLGRAAERVGRLRALRLEERAFGSVLIAAINGVALNGEILAQLQSALANVL